MRRLSVLIAPLFASLVLLLGARAALAQDVVPNLCPGSGAVCVGTQGSGPVDLVQSGNHVRFLGSTFLPTVDDTITFGDSTHRFKNPYFSGTLTGVVGTFSGAINGLTFTANATGFQVAGGTSSKTAIFGGNFTTAHGDDLTLTTTASTNVTFPTSGTLATTDSSKYVCTNTAASTAITGTATKTYFSLNCKLPASTLAAGRSIKLDARGIYSGNATDTLVMTLDACTVSGCASGTVVNLATTSALTLLAVANQYWELDTQTMAFTIGGTGTLDTQGKAGYETAATTMVYDATPNTATATVSTTVDEYLSISVTFSTNSGSDSATLRNLRVIVQ